MIKPISKYQLLLCILTVFALPATADKGIDGALKITGIAPKGIEVLSTELNSHEPLFENKGAHGLKEYCYQTNVYLVYSFNLLGHGYQISKNVPEGLTCSKTKKNIKESNKLGMYIGMAKHEVENLLIIKGLKNNSTIIWLSEIEIKGKKFELQTYLEMVYKREKLEWISVFTTTTR